MESNRNLGIVTFHRAINYGAVLQVYALQNMITKLGKDSHVIDYRNPILEKKHQEKSILKSKGLKDIIKYFLLYRDYNKKHKKFREFSRQHLDISETCITQNDLKEQTTKYSAFICGSDQVWNHNITEFDTTYFLSFADKKQRKSYAASFGISNIEEQLKDKYAKLLNEFNNLATREKQGSEIIKELTGREAEIVLDPTLLLDKDEWFKLSSNNIIEEKYVLIYGFGGSKNLIPLAKSLARKQKLKVIIIGNSHKKDKEITYIKSAGPKDWLSLFKNAEYVFTNSFHGTAFSINFQKNFYVELLPAETGVNSRIEDILALFNLKHRLIKSSDNLIFESSIDYEQVMKILKMEREKSIDILKEIIN